MLSEINEHVNSSQTVVLISTVLPGTIRTYISPLLEKSNLIYNPYFIAMGSVAYDMTNPDLVMIGTLDGTECAPLITLYRSIIKTENYHTGTWEEAECLKVFYNTWISTKLGLVNMIQDVAVRLGNTDVDVITDALKSSEKRITGPAYMTAGLGDSGGCHPRDNIALSTLSRDLNLGYDWFGSVMSMREKQAANMAAFVLAVAEANNIGRIVIHGKSFKPGVPYIDGSYSLLVGHYVIRNGSDVLYVDPLTGDNPKIDEPSVFLLAHDSAVTYQHTGAAPSQELYCEIPLGSIVVDPWRSHVPQGEYRVIPYGDSRQCTKLAM